MRTNHRFFAPIAVAILTHLWCGRLQQQRQFYRPGHRDGLAVESQRGSRPNANLYRQCGGRHDSSHGDLVRDGRRNNRFASTGVYTAPMSVPATPDTVMAMSQGSTGSAIVNVTASQTLQISPSGPSSQRVPRKHLLQLPPAIRLEALPGK